MEKFKWLQQWTIFYWAWWISWAPFVGIFIARVSRGRTIKEFILGVLFVPALVCFLFFAVFGASAIYLQDHHIANIAKAATETATFATLEQYPLGFILSIITLVVIMIFFCDFSRLRYLCTGHVKCSWRYKSCFICKGKLGYYHGTICNNYDLHWWQQAIQNLLIIAALPFSLVIIVMIWSLFKSLSDEKPRPSNKVLVKDKNSDILEYRSSKTKNLT